MVTTNYLSVKSMIVLLCVKMNGDMNTVNILKIFTVPVHSQMLNQLNVMELGTVLISKILVLK
jgi:hypothetical protein